ncbi:MAG: hypothetical protein GH144_01295 [Clostridia bacterium]|jgi:hypothetical protein|nr:hypothetical protein [Clostridia bacterium]
MATNISSECDVCDVLAGGVVLFRQYCQPNPEKKCQSLIKEFQKGNMSLDQLGKRLGASPEFLKTFGVDSRVTPREIIERK